MSVRKRKLLRLREYDYSQEGYYFVTICVEGKKCVLGEVECGEMKLNEVGRMVEKWWRKLFERCSDEIEMDEYIVMPNHFHGIISIVGAKPCFRPDVKKGKNVVLPLRALNAYSGLGFYISWFKRMSTNEYIRNVKQGRFSPFKKRFWQRNYYEHVIRNDEDLIRIQEYISGNPGKWEEDEYYQS